MQVGELAITMDADGNVTTTYPSGDPVVQTAAERAEDRNAILGNISSWQQALADWDRAQAQLEAERMGQ